jgi:hypothetical protein
MRPFRKKAKSKTTLIGLNNFKFFIFSMFYFVYILQFDKSKKLYKGYAKNLKLRLE